MTGIYIHIPFCKKACTYCNFHFSTSLQTKGTLLEALKKEISITELYDSTGNDVATIYFGGGTPSLLSAEELSSTLVQIHSKFQVRDHAEITLEANPDDINPDTLQSWLQLGINRLSVGIQSFNEKELGWMNRAHNATESLQCIEDIKRAGFTNFSVDLIYGSPLQSNDDLHRNLDIIFSNNIPHISCYALTVEPKTALNKMIELHTSPPVDTDRQAEQFQLLLSRMQQAGYEQYEISNFAKPGFRSRHNSSYWQGKPYYGFGPAAHSFDGNNTRRWNVANNALYIQSLSKDILPFEAETLTDTQRLNEYIMTSLRTSEGLDLKRVREEFGEKHSSRISVQSIDFIRQQHMILSNECLILTNEGKFLADGIASDLFAD
ncbi:radical SAM family heme chaperone HemW [Ferruginibacter sp. HRS2-29]|uniref:radical SAM family heme chaperone HemW n=1 Tax=Ferruginibacter sp. HRS2-29 TaxID=2487334 RepID=UPI0020CBADC4|nr:radical SAM family heme chaperone HemW [Ferruginibacter sp. HRS2-29]MCP9751731.1 radical SAM family heme chaperone HemW [Ferruginibacter sp. HRS2-29]